MVPGWPMRLKLLPAVLSLIAGSADVIGFLGLAGLFVAHITGNLVVLAAHVVTGQTASVPGLLSVPVFMLVLGLTRVLVPALEDAGRRSLVFLLLLQFLLLAAFLALSIAAGPRIEPNAANAIIAGMFGVSALAVQNALVQISLEGTPATDGQSRNLEPGIHHHPDR